MSTYALPIVGPAVDKVVGRLEDNPVFKLPLVGALLQQVVELALDAASIFAVALTFGGGLFYYWPSVAGLSPHHLGTLIGYWAYVLAALGLMFVLMTYDMLRHEDKRRADILRKDNRAGALQALSVPGLFIMLAWLITTYIS